MSISRNYTPEGREQIVRAAQRYQNGDEEAFRFLYAEFHKGIYRYCLKILMDESAAKDAFQETFIKCVEYRHSFHPESFGSWLYAIARNACYKYLRIQKKNEIYDDENYCSCSNDSDVFLREHIAKAINTLSLDLKQALILREYEELSYQEIADVLAIDISLAKVRVHRARLLVRAILEPIIAEGL